MIISKVTNVEFRVVTFSEKGGAEVLRLVGVLRNPVTGKYGHAGFVDVAMTKMPPDAMTELLAVLNDGSIGEEKAFAEVKDLDEDSNDTKKDDA